MIVGVAMNSKPSSIVSLPPGVETTTSTRPAAWGGVVTVRVFSSVTVTPVPASPPKATVVAPATKPLPVMVTTSPPVSAPRPGSVPCADVIESITGVATYVNVCGALAPPGPVTTTGTSPAACAGVGKRNCVTPSTVMSPAATATPSTVTPLPGTKPVPVTVTSVPPAVGP